MSCTFTCDCCKKQMPADVYDGQFHPPEGWFGKIVDGNVHVVCSKECEELSRRSYYSNPEIVELEPVKPIATPYGPHACPQCKKTWRFKRIIDGALYRCTCGYEFYYQK